MSAEPKGVLLAETRLARRPRTVCDHDGTMYHGEEGRPPRGERGAGFLLTRPSFLNLLARVGFTSACEVLDPGIEPVVPSFVAFKGRRVALATAPQTNATTLRTWPESARSAET